MSEENGGGGKDDAQEGRETAAELLVRLRKDGSIHVEGPIINKVVCLGMLQDAMLAIHDFHIRRKAARQAQGVQPATMNDLKKALEH